MIIRGLFLLPHEIEKLLALFFYLSQLVSVAQAEAVFIGTKRKPGLRRVADLIKSEQLVLLTPRLLVLFLGRAKQELCRAC